MKKQLTFIIVFLAVSCSRDEKRQVGQNEDSKENKAEYRVSQRYTPSLIESYDSAELRIKRNEIFAQYGYKFKSPELMEYFLKTGWYEPQYDNVDSFLTELDKENIRMLSAFEKERNEFEGFNCTNFPNALTSFLFNSMIQTAIDSLGTPNRTFIHEDLTCPIGQLHYWKDNVANQQLVILGDDYSSKVNYLAKSRYYAIHSLNTTRPSQFSFSGLKLGEADKLVKKKVDCLMTKNPSFVLDETTGNSIVEVHYIEDQAKQYVISTKDLFIRLIMDSNKRLKAIAFSTFNDHRAC